MHRRQAAAQIVVIHAGHVVMHERIGVQRLDGRGGGHRLRLGDAIQRGRFEHQKGAQPLAALRRITHRLAQRSGGQPGHRRIQRGLHRALHLRQTFGKHQSPSTGTVPLG